MDYAKIIDELTRNKEVFRHLFQGLPEDLYLWKSAPDKWCLLEVICHLGDEEREDFRARTKHVLETPNDPMIPIDPAAWVLERGYVQEDYQTALEGFLGERDASLKWLHSLKSPKWENAYQHPKVGPITAKFLLANWLAHDYMHIRQILRIKIAFFQQYTGEGTDYAGNW